MSPQPPTAGHLPGEALTCLVCGKPLEEGGCPEHDVLGGGVRAVGGPSSHAGGAAGRAGRKALLAVAGLALAIAVACVVVLALDQLRLADLEHQLASLRHQTTSQLKAQQSRARAVESSQAAAINALAGRLDSVAAQISSSPNPAAIAKVAEASVFTVSTTTGDQGTAWVASASNGTSTLVTNFHVVETEWDGGGRTVQLAQGQNTYAGKIVAVSAVKDLAAIQVAQAFPALTSAQSLPSPGDPVVVIGSPLGLGGSVVNGIVSAIQTINGQSYIQFSAPISPGNSGSPVLNGSGKVVGIAEAKVEAAGVEGLGFAIPVSTACSTVVSC